MLEVSPMRTVCPSCEAVNKIDPGRLGKHPQCGKCKADLLPARPVEVDAKGLDKRVEHSDLPLLVDFWAPWCGPCRVMEPAFAEAARLLAPHVRLLKLNTQDNPEPSRELGIHSIPTMVLFKDGREVARISGAMTADKIAGFVKSQVVV